MDKFAHTILSIAGEGLKAGEYVVLIAVEDPGEEDIAERAYRYATYADRPLAPSGVALHDVKADARLVVGVTYLAEGMAGRGEHAD